MLRIKVKKISPAAVLPKQGTPGSAGFDLTATGMETIDMFHTRYRTGIAVEIPEGHVGLIFPRSSCYKNGMLLTNCVGVIDSDYRGEICAVFLGTCADLQYKVGDRIAQMIILPIPAVEYQFAEELSTTERGTGGYGSTGKMIHSRHTVTYDTEEIKELRSEIRYLCYCVQAFAFCSRDVRCSAARIIKRLDEMPTEDNTLNDLHRHYLALLRKKGDLEFKGILYNAMLKRRRKRTRRNRK